VAADARLGACRLRAVSGKMWHVAEPPSRDDLERRIDELTHAADADHATIRGLEQHADADQETIHGLQLQAEVDHAIIDHLEAEGDVDREKIANLETALVTARRIGAAIGVLMSRHQVTDAQAFNLLREASQMNHRKLREVAEDVVLTGTIPKM
jgi:hypothetical protein